MVALDTGGPLLSLAAIGLVIIIHAIEAYLLNPIIYGKHLKLNPVFTLIILFVGYHAFGLWGMLLRAGRPLLIHDVFGGRSGNAGGPPSGRREGAAAAHFRAEAAR